MGVISHQIISLSVPPDLSSDPHTTQTSGCVGRGLFVPTLIFFKNFSPRSSLTAVFSLQLNRHGRGLTHPFWNVTVPLQETIPGVGVKETLLLPTPDSPSPPPHDFPLASPPLLKPISLICRNFFFFFLTKLKNSCVCGVYKRSIPLLDLG